MKDPVEVRTRFQRKERIRLKMNGCVTTPQRVARLCCLNDDLMARHFQLCHDVPAPCAAGKHHHDRTGNGRRLWRPGILRYVVQCGRCGRRMRANLWMHRASRRSDSALYRRHAGAEHDASLPARDGDIETDIVRGRDGSLSRLALSQQFSHRDIRVI